MAKNTQNFQFCHGTIMSGIFWLPSLHNKYLHNHFNFQIENLGVYTR